MNKLDNFISIKPAIELQKYVDSYYFHSCDNPGNTLKYTYYPHTKHAITIYLGSRIETKENITIVKPEKSNVSILYSTVVDGPHRVEINGSFKKIGIVFNPYGCNHFITNKIEKFKKGTISTFEEWNPEFAEIAQKIWSIKDNEERRIVLDSFLMKQKKEEINHKFNSIIDDMLSTENVITTHRLSARYNLSRKTLYRMFIREIGYSPSKFLKIVRFRKSLETYLQTQKTNLSEAAVTQFYDQSDFIKTVKQITHTVPKKLTQELSDLENTIFWKLE